MDVPVEGSNEELAVQQTPDHHSSRSVPGRGVDGLPCMRPLGAARVCLCQRYDVSVVAALSCPQPPLWGGLSRLQRCRIRRSRKQQQSVSDRSGTRPRAMQPGSISGGVRCPSDAGGAWKLRLVQQEVPIFSKGAEPASAAPTHASSETQGGGCLCAHHHTLLARWLVAWR